jgi:hypothetical protein
MGGHDARPQPERNDDMHYLMLITLTMLPGETSLAARRRTFNLLIEDDSFCGEGGRFGSPICDWFVLGGRWSGYLRETLLGQPYRDALALRFPILAGDSFSASYAKAHGPALDALWREYGGCGPSPFNRSGYDQLGDDDDAMPVDRTIFDHFLAEYRGESDRKENSYRCTFADLNDEEVDESFIGRKWIAVVDYHN